MAVNVFCQYESHKKKQASSCIYVSGHPVGITGTVAYKFSKGIRNLPVITEMVQLFSYRCTWCFVEYEFLSSSDNILPTLFQSEVIASAAIYSVLLNTYTVN